MDALHRTEQKFDRELRDGKCVDASINLQQEFQKNPKEALAIIQREQQRESNPNNKDKATIGVGANGDVFVYDQNHTGYYAGSIPKEFLPQQAAAPQTSDQPTQLAPPAPPPAEQAPAPAPIQHEGFHIPSPIDIGVHDGSLQIGVNILGLAKGGITLGEQNRGYVGSDLLKSEVSAGVDLNERHIGPAADINLIDHKLLDAHGRVGATPTRDGVILGGRADASAIDGLVQAGGHGGAELGRKIGPDAGGYAYVGPARAEANGHATISDQGLRAGVSGRARVEYVAGVATGAQVGLGTRNEAHVDANVSVADSGVRGGLGLYPQLRPDVYLRGYSADDPDQ